MHKCFYLLFFVLFLQTVEAQQKISGQVVDAETLSVLSNVSVLEIKSNRWTATDENGNFTLEVGNLKDISLKFNLLGKEELTQKFQGSQSGIIVQLREANLRLEEIVLNVKKSGDFSEIRIAQEAIQQVQGFSLDDILQQLPGQAVSEFNINEFKNIVFRTANSTSPYNNGESFGNKAMGTAIVMDGIPISNNENMQSYVGNFGGSPFSPNVLGFGDIRNYTANANFGVDLREIPADNIESIEIVQGIPSVKYGDLTSGLINIKQKAGTTPFRLFTSLREGTSQYGIAKGFKINEKAGFVNLSLNYLNSSPDKRVSFTDFERISINSMWSWTNAQKNIRNSFSVDYSMMLDKVNREAEDANMKTVKNENKDISFSNRFRWNFIENFFDAMDFNANFSYSKQYSYDGQFINNGGKVVGTSFTPGVYQATYTPPSYMQGQAVDGKPINGFASVALYKTFDALGFVHNFSVGSDFRYSDNKGKGRLGGPETLNTILAGTGVAFRPYNFGDYVRAETQFSAYIEDNFSKNWDKTSLTVMAGLRYDNQYGNHLLAPRVNSFFTYEKFKLRGGLGLTSKAPTLNQIYTGPRFYDYVLGDYRLPGFYNLPLVQTFVDRANNENLKPSRSFRTELGFDYILPFGQLAVTGYYNQLFDGITNQTLPSVRDLAILEITYNNPNLPTWEISGYSPLYFNQSQLVNGLNSNDKGVEFLLSITKLPLKNFTFDLQGSFVETRNNYDGFDYRISTDNTRAEKWGVFTRSNSGSQQFRLSGNLNYHLPKVGLIIGVRSEHFILDDVIFKGNDYPFAYLDANQNMVPIPEADRSNPALYGHIFPISLIRTEDELQKVYHNFHLRISKDFLNGFRFSFYSNNFLDLQHKHIDNRGRLDRKSGMAVLSFGTKVEYQF